MAWLAAPLACGIDVRPERRDGGAMLYKLVIDKRPTMS
jgi:hypothetical protein